MKAIFIKQILLISLVIGILILLFNTFINEYQDYEVLNIDKTPKAIYEHYEQQKYKTGYSVIPYDNSKYVLITRGEVNTAGHKIKVQKVLKTKDKWVIKVRFIAPDPDDIVAMVISYPAIVVKLPEEAVNIQVLEDGKHLSKLN
ncbi:hypothetical protein BBF96_08530 [Anoxybacter fermentans]|uniref:PrcB C-terminal domain-containing protein n=1 Tax=Anoxybacter fermentans TaxID=1323375 RepID=A0A3Q9HQW9_9FIRM|nr:protease complex subunit PrcB family protein [Anoxybacter fermentans]AZR73424.1 hypothetical protein BBF96_08530 [Anoxybacter fermentans]